MSLSKILIGIAILIISLFLVKFGQVDDAPGVVLIAIALFGFGLYVIIRNKKKTRKK